MKYNALLFDFDGTLTESGLGITRSVACAFEQLKLPVPSQEELETFIGPPLATSFMKYAPLSEEEALNAAELFRVRYRAQGWKENRVYAGIAPLLKALKQQGVYLAIASAKPEVFVHQIADHFGIEKYFDRIVGITFEHTNSDKSELIAAALPENADRSRIAMIGDRLYDMEAGKKQGLTAIGAGYGYGSREELEASGADIVCDSVADLHALLLPDVEKERGVWIALCGADEALIAQQQKKLESYIGDRGYETQIADAAMGLADIETAVKNGKIVISNGNCGLNFENLGCERELKYGFVRPIDINKPNITPDCTLLFTADKLQMSDGQTQIIAPGRDEAVIDREVCEAAKAILP